jgi:hypothetical protein
MKVNLFLAAFLTLVSGCSHIPGTESTVPDTKSTPPMLISSTQETSLVAECIAKNIEDNYAAFFPMPVKEGSRKGVLELRVRSQIGFAAIIEIEPAEQGSVITTRISNHYLARETLMKLFTSGC